MPVRCVDVTGASHWAAVPRRLLVQSKELEKLAFRVGWEALRGRSRRASRQPSKSSAPQSRVSRCSQNLEKQQGGAV